MGRFSISFSSNRNILYTGHKHMLPSSVFTFFLSLFLSSHSLKQTNKPSPPPNPPLFKNDPKYLCFYDINSSIMDCYGSLISQCCGKGFICPHKERQCLGLHPGWPAQLYYCWNRATHLWCGWRLHCTRCTLCGWALGSALLIHSLPSSLPCYSTCTSHRAGCAADMWLTPTLNCHQQHMGPFPLWCAGYTGGTQTSGPFPTTWQWEQWLLGPADCTWTSCGLDSAWGPYTGPP